MAEGERGEDAERPDAPAPWAPLEPGEGDAAPPAPPPAPGPPGMWPPPAAQPPMWPPPPGWQAPPGWQPPGPVLPKAGDARTGPLPLHPMTLSDILDGAFKLFKANARTVILATAAFVVPVTIVVAFLQRNSAVNLSGVFSGRSSTSSVDSVQVPVLAYVLTLVDYVVLRPMVAGAVSWVVAESYLGRQTAPEDALRVAGRRAWALVASSLLVHLLEGIGFVLCIVPGVMVLGLFVGVAPAIVVEGLGPLRGMRRSARLLRPRVFRVAGIAILAGLMAAVLTSVLGGIPSVVASAIGPAGWPVRAAGAIAATLVTTPFVAIVATLLYFDGRIRQEGFDLQLMADELARRPPPPS